MGIRENLLAVRAEIASACRRTDRDPAEVTLVGISKTFPVESVIQAIDAGLADLGENKVQEALPKIVEARAAGRTARWHLVGHLQTNKVRQAVEAFNLIHSVDSLHLAESLSRHAVNPVSILLEVNIGAEASKFGFAPVDVEDAARKVARLPKLQLLGLMTVAPVANDPNDLRPLFASLRQIRDSLGLRHLSMGMTDDYRVAIEEGSTMVRLGRAIFGERASASDGQAAQAETPTRTRTSDR